MPAWVSLRRARRRFAVHRAIHVRRRQPQMVVPLGLVLDRLDPHENVAAQDRQWLRVIITEARENLGDRQKIRAIRITGNAIDDVSAARHDVAWRGLTEYTLSQLSLVEGKLAEAERHGRAATAFAESRGQLGAYVAGSDPLLDQAIAAYPRLESYLQQDMRQCVPLAAGAGELDQLLATIAS